MSEKVRDQLLAIIDEETNIDVEINQNLYPKPDWAVAQIVRSSGLVEDISKSGCGHPNAGWLKIHDPDGSRGFDIHGCDGECCPDMKEKIEEAYKKRGDE